LKADFFSREKKNKKKTEKKNIIIITKIVSKRTSETFAYLLHYNKLPDVYKCTITAYKCNAIDRRIQTYKKNNNNNK